MCCTRFPTRARTKPTWCAWNCYAAHNDGQRVQERIVASICHAFTKPAEVIRRSRGSNPFLEVGHGRCVPEISQEEGPIFSGAGLTTSALHRRELLGVFGQFAPLLSEVQINLPNCRIRSCHSEPLAFSHLFPAHLSPFAHLLTTDKNAGRSSSSRHVAYPETHPPEIRSGGCSILHVEAKVLYATGELGNRPGRDLA